MIIDLEEMVDFFVISIFYWILFMVMCVVLYMIDFDDVFSYVIYRVINDLYYNIIRINIVK